MPCAVHAQKGQRAKPYKPVSQALYDTIMHMDSMLFNAFNARSETATALRHLFSNPWLWVALGLSLGLQIAVVNLGFLNYAFGTVPLTFEQWLLCAAMASTVLWHAELRKLTGRAWRRHARTRTAAAGGPQ